MNFNIDIIPLVIAKKISEPNVLLNAALQKFSAESMWVRFLNRLWVLSVYPLQCADAQFRKDYIEFRLKSIVHWAASCGLFDNLEFAHKLQVIRGDYFFREFSCINVLTREKASLWAGKINTIKPIPAYNLSTSGSTGSPMRFSIDRDLFLRRAFIIHYMLYALHYAEKPRILRLAYNDMPWSKYQGTYLDPHNLDAAYLKELLSFYRPNVLYGTVSRCILFAEFAAIHRILYRFDIIITRSEHLTVAVRKFLENSLGGKVYNVYASREFGPIGQECFKQEGFHVNEDALFVEVVDDKGRPVDKGQTGEIVITSFFNRSLPFIRYRIGDQGRFMLDDCCACGLSTPRIIFEGRTCDYILLPNNKKFPVLDLCIPMNDLREIRTFQFIQSSKKELLVQIVLRPHVDSDRAIKSVRSALEKFLAVRSSALPIIKINLVDDIPLLPNGKRPLLTSRVLTN